MIGFEAREQLLAAEGRLPEAAVACVGGGSNAIGLFAGFLEDAAVRLVGVEADGAASLGRPAGRPSCTARAPRCSPTRTGRCSTPSRSPPGSTIRASAPSTRSCATRGRAEYLTATDEEALAAFRRLARTEGILPALEPAHALARAAELDAELVLVCLSGAATRISARWKRHEDARRST